MTKDTNFHRWPARYQAWQLEVFESERHQIWLGLSDLRRVLPGLRRDAALAQDYPAGVAPLDRSKRLYLDECSVRAELQRHRGPEAMRFLAWFEKTLIYPAARKREHLPPARPARRAPTRAAPCALPGHRLIRLWRGEMDLGHTFFAGGLWTLTCVLLLAGLIYSVAHPAHYQGDYLRRQWIIATSVLLCTLAPLWWCVGLMRCALRYQRTQRSLWLAFLAYGSACAFLLASAANTLSAAGEWAAGTMDALTNRNKNAVVQVIHDPVLGRMVLRGEIGFGSYQVLKKALAQAPRLRLLELESPGGYVIEGLAMARLIQDNALDTVSLERCASACTLLLAAGHARYIGPQAQIGFHRSWGTWSKAGDGWSASDYQIADYYRARGTSANFIAQAMNTPAATLWLPDPLRMLGAGYATHLWEDRPPGI